MSPPFELLLILGGLVLLDVLALRFRHDSRVGFAADRPRHGGWWGS
jgi:hypothetical protein